MDKDKDYEKLRLLINTILNMDRNDLRRLQNLLNNIAHIPSFNADTNLLDLKESSKWRNSSVDKDKQQLVGMLPYVLLDKKYFPTNDLLSLFAKKNLGIDIKYYKKKSRNEILGTIVAEVVKKNPSQIHLFIQALNKIIGKEKKGEVRNFFLEWDKVIRGE
jgi:hypothetical protein